MPDDAGEIPVNPAADDVVKMPNAARTHAKECIDGAFDAQKQRWDATHKPSKVKKGDSVLISTKHFGLVGSRKFKDPWVGLFVVEKLIGDNAVRVSLTHPYDKKHNVFPISLIKIVEESMHDRLQEPRKAPL